ncbi:MAG TPA: TIGR03667 family PPOX class F420-dependent oxidoreductase [Roseiflexaceae bacterium]|nr:TIGR03667 family PPOX class F420-dependent oxidoreductase [Roseiflexaceae bacterium]HMP40863.1 TIGR03667 family PPOX class F420-dependent oxidoreductase [Roseiflexaceae bacterium]
MEIDQSTEFGRRVLRRLHAEQIIWLTTVGADGTPQPSPVWFIWEAGTLLIYSRPDAPKVRNIGRHPQVALNFNSDAHGDDIVVLVGTAEILLQAPTVGELPAYIEKYRRGMASLNMTPAAFAEMYSCAIRVTPRRLRGY